MVNCGYLFHQRVVSSDNDNNGNNNNALNDLQKSLENRGPNNMGFVGPADEYPNNIPQNFSRYYNRRYYLYGHY